MEATVSVVGKVVVARVNHVLRQAEQRRRRQLERELSAFVGAADRRDLLAAASRYGDADTQEVRDILTMQEAGRSRRRCAGMDRPLR